MKLLISDRKESNVVNCVLYHNLLILSVTFNKGRQHEQPV